MVEGAPAGQVRHRLVPVLRTHALVEVDLGTPAGLSERTSFTDKSSTLRAYTAAMTSTILDHGAWA